MFYLKIQNIGYVCPSETRYFKKLHSIAQPRIHYYPVIIFASTDHHRVGVHSSFDPSHTTYIGTRLYPLYYTARERSSLTFLALLLLLMLLSLWVSGNCVIYIPGFRLAWSAFFPFLLSHKINREKERLKVYVMRAVYICIYIYAETASVQHVM